jgi:hypothetical protein
MDSWTARGGASGRHRLIGEGVTEETADAWIAAWEVGGGAVQSRAPRAGGRLERHYAKTAGAAGAAPVVRCQ